jgi:GNAT superfamily N-acetyltransferase
VTVQPPAKLKIETFVLRIGDVRDVELDSLHTLSLAVGWPHRAEDWQFLRNFGQGVLALDEIGRVIGSTMWFPYRDDFANIGMVITSPRLQTLGTAQWLMQCVFSKTEGRNYRLNATRAAQRLYLSLGFQPEKTVYQCQGTVRPSASVSRGKSDGVVRQLRSEDLRSVIDRDTLAFGVSRSSVLGALFAQSTGYGLFRDGKLYAFSLGRSFGRGYLVGPVVAANDDDAIAVVRPHIVEHDGMFVRLDTHHQRGDFSDFLIENGLPVYDTVLTMSLGKRLADFMPNQPDPPTTYALASQALG